MHNQIIDDHIIFTNVVSNENTDLQFDLFSWGGGGGVIFDNYINF